MKINFNTLLLSFILLIALLPAIDCAIDEEDIIEHFAEDIVPCDPYEVCDVLYDCELDDAYDQCMDGLDDCEDPEGAALCLCDCFDPDDCEATADCLSDCEGYCK